jgi:hypothetical protein
MQPFRRYFITLAIMAAISIALRLIWEISSGITLTVLLIGWPLCGTLITIDDDLPGGWSNPDGKVVPEWRTLWWWADLLLVRGAIVVLAFALENASEGHFALHLLVASALMIAVGLPIFLRGVKREIANAV